jgi:predicted GTPase
MLWFAIPVIGLIAKVVYDAVTVENETTPLRNKSTLEVNLERLREELRTNSGRKIAILGQPGAGKSSLLNKMTMGEVRPLPIIGGQTDATDWSGETSCNLLSSYKDFVFVDVPGYDTLSHPTSVFASSCPFDYFDAFIFVIHGKLHSSDEEIFQLISNSGKRICIAKSFSESLDGNEKTTVESDIRKRLSISNTAQILFFSNRTGCGIKAVFKSIRSNIQSM